MKPGMVRYAPYGSWGGWVYLPCKHQKSGRFQNIFEIGLNNPLNLPLRKIRQLEKAASTDLYQP
jgi:hypothetical protein